MKMFHTESHFGLTTDFDPRSSIKELVSEVIDYLERELSEQEMEDLRELRVGRLAVADTARCVGDAYPLGVLKISDPVVRPLTGRYRRVGASGNYASWAQTTTIRRKKMDHDMLTALDAALVGVPTRTGYRTVWRRDALRAAAQYHQREAHRLAEMGLWTHCERAVRDAWEALREYQGCPEGGRTGDGGLYLCPTLGPTV